MRLLVDTHVFIWLCGRPERLWVSERTAIESGHNQLFVSAASAWEIAIKQAAGRLMFPISRFGELAESFGLDVLAMTAPHGIAAGALPRHHDDPFDRMLIAQARVEGLVLLTRDRKMPMYDVPIFGTGEPQMRG